MIRLLIFLLISPAFASDITSTAQGEDAKERDKEISDTRGDDRPLAEPRE